MRKIGIKSVLVNKAETITGGLEVRGKDPHIEVNISVLGLIPTWRSSAKRKLVHDDQTTPSSSVE